MITFQQSPSVAYVGDEGFQEVGLVPQRVVDEPIAEGDDAMGEVVLCQPRYHPLLLHVGAARDIDNEVAEVLPVPRRKGTSQWLANLE